MPAPRYAIVRIAAAAFVAAGSLLLTQPMARSARAEGDEQVIVAGLTHLGDNEVERWADISVSPQGTELDVRFEARARGEESLLRIVQEDINHDWVIALNGVDVGRLKKIAARTDAVYPIPGGVLLDGENRLTLRGTTPGDDVLLGDVRLISKSLREYYRLGRLRVSVRDEAGAGLPARVTIVTADGARPELFHGDETTALRNGIAYTQDGRLAVEVPAGAYIVSATRGMEWSLDRAEATIVEGGEAAVGLSLRREVDTTGFVAADTHIHTLEHSGHGDASERERLITLAGEGVELAIATDHNHNIDYRANQLRMGLRHAFTPVVGNEVTTPIGHFNAFPLDPNDEVPPFDLRDWTKIVTGMRERGAKVVILNHPRWPEIDTGPFGEFGLDRKTGARERGPERLGVDAIEVINSGTLQPDPTYLLDDWFALLNTGEPALAVGSSDSHTVGDPVGQGRTYIRSSTDDPSAIDVDEACDAILRGVMSVSMGIFVDLSVAGEVEMGGVYAPTGAIPIEFRVAAPGFVRPRMARVYMNGIVVAERVIESAPGRATDVILLIEVPAPTVDAHLVCVASGDGIDDPAWPTAEPYTLGVTNPVWIDADGDGRYRSLAESAAMLGKTEVEELHRFFDDWFNGRLERSEASFDRFAQVLAAGFEIVGPSGVKLSRDSVLGAVEQAHGARPTRISVRNVDVRRIGDGLLVVTYEEWQDDGDGPRGRLSSALLREKDGLPNGLQWLHVHETWLPTDEG